MITTLRPFSSKEKLQEQVSTQPYLICVKGTLYDKDGRESMFNDTLDRIPYKGKVIAKHKDTIYCFRKKTDGGYSVE